MSSLPELTASVPSLSVALANLLPERRLDHLKMVARGLPMVDGLENAGLDEEILRHIGFIRAAIEGELVTPEVMRDKLVEESMSLASWYAKNNNPRIPKSMAILVGEVAGQWSDGETNEERANALLKQIATFYLQFKSPWLREVVRSCVNKVSGQCSLKRLTNGLKTLYELHDWKPGGDLFETVAFARLKKLLATDTALVVSDAMSRDVLGYSPSAKAQELMFDFAVRIGDLDRTVESLRAMLAGTWAISEIDPEGKKIGFILRMPAEAGEDAARRAFESAVRKVEHWNDEHPCISVTLSVSVGGFGLFASPAT